MIRRWISSLALVALPLFAFAGELDDARQVLGPVFEDIGGQDAYWFSSTGSVRTNTGDHTLQDWIGVSFVKSTVGGQEVTRLELEALTYRDGYPIRRVVGDGNNLWDYDGVYNTYRVIRYGNSLTGASASGTQRFSYIDTVGTMLRSRASGPSAMLYQFVEQALLAREEGAQIARGWLPFLSNSAVHVDQDAYTITGTTGGMNAVTSTYQWYKENGSEPRLASISFQQTKMVSGSNQVTDWTATFHRDEVMPNMSLTFNPGNARLMSVALRQGG